MVEFSRAFAALLAIALAGVTPPADAEMHVIDQVGNAFVPQEITVQRGDTVRWVWSGGFHTVTSGTNCEPDDVFFNEPLAEFNPIVEFVIPGDLVNDIFYFCTPHCFSDDMVGILFVELGCAGDFDESGEVDFEDLVGLLANFGPCPEDCPWDLNDDQEVNFSDLLALLANWGPCE